MGQHRGGIASLYRLVERHGEPLEADLAQYYGLDLTDLFRPGSRLTWRRLRVLVRQLPPESRLAAAQAGHDVWPGERHLLADLVDISQVHAQLLGVIASQRRYKKPPIGKPTFVPRPGETAPAKLRLEPDAFVRWFHAQHGLGTSA